MLLQALGMDLEDLFFASFLLLSRWKRCIDGVDGVAVVAGNSGSLFLGLYVIKYNFQPFNTTT